MDCKKNMENLNEKNNEYISENVDKVVIQMDMIYKPINEEIEYIDINKIDYQTEMENNNVIHLKNEDSNYIFNDEFFHKEDKRGEHNEMIKMDYFNSNSPLSMSRSNSDHDYNSYSSDNSSDDEMLCNIKKKRLENQINDVFQKKRKNSDSFNNKTYDEIEQSLSKYYDYENKYTSKLDILITFIRGQKSIYLQAKNITQLKLYLLMIPTLVLSTIVAIVSPMIHSYHWGGDFVAGMNAAITTFVTLMNYLKLESLSEMYLQLSKQYDKLEMSLEMTNNKLLFLEEKDDKNELVLSKLHEVEIKLNEMREVYNILIPNELFPFFPIICNINIFSMIKHMEKHKKHLIYKFMDVKNEIRYILHKWKHIENEMENSIEKIQERKRLLFLYDIKEKIKTELLDCKNVYSHIDIMFSKEIKKADDYTRLFILLSYIFRCCSIQSKRLFDTEDTGNITLNNYLCSILHDK